VDIQLSHTLVVRNNCHMSVSNYEYISIQEDDLESESESRERERVAQQSNRFTTRFSKVSITWIMLDVSTTSTIYVANE
jgi:PHD/YefM family antitoxin component YafN of YafNO toxin-antitoxin module